MTSTAQIACIVFSAARLSRDLEYVGHTGVLLINKHSYIICCLPATCDQLSESNLHLICAIAMFAVHLGVRDCELGCVLTPWAFCKVQYFPVAVIYMILALY